MKSHASPAVSAAPAQPAPAPQQGADDQALLGNAFLQEQSRQSGPPDDHHHDHEHGPANARDATRPETPRTKADALARHRRDLTFVERIIQSGLSVQPDPSQGFNSRPNLLHNSCEWIDQGEATMFVLSPIHDSHLRPAIGADQTGYFDNRVNWTGAGSDYDATLDASGRATNNAGISIEFSGVLGTMSGDGTTLTLIDPVAQGEALVVETIIHEVQHDADQHKAGDPWAVTRPAADPAAGERAPNWAYNSYQSEFRAYWMENPEGSAADNFQSSTDLLTIVETITAVMPGADNTHGTADDATFTATTNFVNARQQSIFDHMYNARADGIYWDPTLDSGNGDWTVTYGYLPYYYAVDPAFRAMVDAYDTPRAGNIVNSVRIQALSEAIATGTIATVTAAVANLDALDQTYLSDRTQSQPLWDQARAALSAADFATFEASIGAPMGPWQGERVTVQRGDTLSALAARYLNDSARWREIYTLNRATIGRDPDVLAVGAVLSLPRM
jgi:hypothetical protein